MDLNSSFLAALVSTNSELRILETGICRGNRLVDWFYTNSSGLIARRSNKSIKETKLLLQHFLDVKLRLQSIHSPQEVICYLYHGKGRKLVTAREVSQLAINQLHGLSVKSVHLTEATSHGSGTVFRVATWISNHELQCDVKLLKFNKNEEGECIKSPEVKDKSRGMAQFIAHSAQNMHSKMIKDLVFDIVFDRQSSNPILLRIINLEFLENYSIVPSPVGALRFTEDGDGSLSDDSSTAKSITKNQHSGKISSDFLEMIAKTFERTRERSQRTELQQLKQTNPLKYEALTKQLSFKNHSAKALYTEDNIISMNDLLFTIRKNRPRSWVEDQCALTVNRTQAIRSAKIQRQSICPTTRRKCALLARYDPSTSSRLLTRLCTTEVPKVEQKSPLKTLLRAAEGVGVVSRMLKQLNKRSS